MRQEICIAFLIFCVLMVIILSYIYYRIYYYNPLLTTVEWQDIAEELDTGDLLFVRYNSNHGKLIKLFTGQDWSHTGFVYRDGEQVSVIEVADYSRYDEPDVENLKGLCIVPIKKWLRLNDNRYCGYRKFIGPRRPAIADINRVIENKRTLQLDMSLYNWAATLGYASYRPENKDNYYCSEFAAYLLQELDILPRNYRAANYSPARLTKIANYDKLRVFYLELP